MTIWEAYLASLELIELSIQASLGKQGRCCIILIVLLGRNSL